MIRAPAAGPQAGHGHLLVSGVPRASAGIAGGASDTTAPGLVYRVYIGHGDWESQNIRWTGRDPRVVHDWDSVVAQPETAIVGLAAAMWPREGGSDPIASVAQTADFITSYQRFAGREWEASEVRNAWAAGLWLGLIFAKQEAAEGGSQQLDRLATEIDERLDRAAHK